MIQSNAQPQREWRGWHPRFRYDDKRITNVSFRSPQLEPVIWTHTTLDIAKKMVIERTNYILHSRHHIPNKHLLDPLDLSPYVLNTLRPRQNGRRFADDTFKCIFLNENVRISIEISLKFVPKGPINNIPALVQIMAWRRSDDKPLSEPMMVNLLTHICVTRPQWVNVFEQFCMILVTRGSSMPKPKYDLIYPPYDTSIDCAVSLEIKPSYPGIYQANRVWLYNPLRHTEMEKVYRWKHICWVSIVPGKVVMHHNLNTRHYSLNTV